MCDGTHVDGDDDERFHRALMESSWTNFEAEEGRFEAPYSDSKTIRLTVLACELSGCLWAGRRVQRSQPG